MEQIILNLVPGGVSPVCYVSQYDVGRKIRLHLRNGSDPYVLSGAETVTVTIRKVSGEELIYDIANTSASYVDLIVNYDATDVIGESVCELIITESGVRLGSANFKMRIDPDVYSGDQKLEVVSATSETPDLSFETNVEENLLELKAGFSPVQDLNGYDHPWPAGGGKNKFPNSSTFPYSSTIIDTYYAEFSPSVNERKIPIIHIEPNVTYTLSMFVTGSKTPFSISVGVGDGRYLADIVTVSGLLGTIRCSATFTATPEQLERGDILAFRAPRYSERGDFTCSVSDVQLEIGSTATDYEPYENVCPIEGWNEVNISGCGVNLFDEDNLVIANYPYPSMTFDKATFLKAGVYMASISNIKNATSWRFGYRFFDKGGNIVKNAITTGLASFESGMQFSDAYDSNQTCLQAADTTVTTVKVTITKDCYLVACISSGDVGASTSLDYQIEKGNTASEYHSYTGKLINLDWNTNQWDEEWELGIYGWTGAKSPDNTRIRCKNLIPCKPNTTLYIKTPSNLQIFYYDISGTFISCEPSSIANATITTPNNCYYLAFYVYSTSYGATYNHDISINYPSTDHTYHPYKGHGVVYAGEVVYKDGVWKLTVTHGGVLATASDLISGPVHTANNGWAFTINNKEAIYKRLGTAISNINKPTYYDQATSSGFCFAISQLKPLFFLADSDTGLDATSTSTQIQSAFETFCNNCNPFAVYELATPIEIPLDQNSKLATVLGVNNLMHDANGGTEVKFFCMISAS